MLSMRKAKHHSSRFMAVTPASGLVLRLKISGDSDDGIANHDDTDNNHPDNRNNNRGHHGGEARPHSPT
jgi:hypothetical protein